MKWQKIEQWKSANKTMLQTNGIKMCAIPQKKRKKLREI